METKAASLEAALCCPQVMAVGQMSLRRMAGRSRLRQHCERQRCGCCCYAAQWLSSGRRLAVFDHDQRVTSRAAGGMVAIRWSAGHSACSLCDDKAHCMDSLIVLAQANLRLLCSALASPAGCCRGSLLGPTSIPADRHNPFPPPCGFGVACIAAAIPHLVRCVGGALLGRDIPNVRLSAHHRSPSTY